MCSRVLLFLLDLYRPHHLEMMAPPTVPIAAALGAGPPEGNVDSFLATGRHTQSTLGPSHRPTTAAASTPPPPFPRAAAAAATAEPLPPPSSRCHRRRRHECVKSRRATGRPAEYHRAAAAAPPLLPLHRHRHHRAAGAAATLEPLPPPSSGCRRCRRHECMRARACARVSVCVHVRCVRCGRRVT